MSTEFLTRRMDLIHSLDMTSKTNYLTMDTSYPVKVKGIIIKEYLATASLETYPYTENQKVFCVRNQANEVVADFTPNECFTFDGDKLDALPAQGEYVMAIIDLDANKIFITPINSIGGGSYKEFNRQIIGLDSGYIANDSDPIIDMMSDNPNAFYKYNDYRGVVTGKQQYPEKYYEAYTDSGSGSTDYNLLSKQKLNLNPLKTKKEHGSVLMLSQKKNSNVESAGSDITAVDFFFDKAQGTKFTTAKVDPQPTLYAGYIAPVDNGNGHISPVDTNAPGTLRMYETDIERDIDEIINSTSGTAYNLLARAASAEKVNAMNYSFVRDSDTMVVYEFYRYTEGTSDGYSMTPVADVYVEDLNRLQSNLCLCTFNSPVVETVKHLTRSYATIESVMGIIQTVGNLSDEFASKYAIPYSTEETSLYDKIMNENNPDPSPLASINYPGAYFDHIKDIHEEDNYSLLISATNIVTPQRIDQTQDMKRMPIRTEDNYFSVATQVPIRFRANQFNFEINMEDSEYAPYINTFWWDQNVDGNRNVGFDILHHDNNYYAAGGPSSTGTITVGRFKELFNSSATNMPTVYASILYDDGRPGHSTGIPAVDIDECVVTYKIDETILTQIKEATGLEGVSDEILDKLIVEFRASSIAQELEDIVYKLDDTSHGTTFQSAIGITAYSTISPTAISGRMQIGTSSELTIPIAYNFEYEMSNSDAEAVYINTADASGFLKVKKMRIVYPHMIDFKNNDYLEEHITVFVGLKYFRAVYFDLNGQTVVKLAFLNVSGVDKAYIVYHNVRNNLLYEDSSFTTEVTKSSYQTFKNANIDKVLYYSSGEKSEAHKNFSDYKITIHFSATDDPTNIQKNDIYYEERIMDHIWDEGGEQWIDIPITEPTKYDYLGRNLALFQNPIYTSLPSCMAFYQSTAPWPKPAIIGEWPPTASSTYGVDFQKWFKTIECWKVFSSNEEQALRKIAMYNRGIADKFIYTDSSKTKYRSLYDFLYDLYSKDVGNLMPDESRAISADSDVYGRRGFFTNAVAAAWSTMSEEHTVTSKWDFKLSSEHPHSSIDTKLIEIQSDPSAPEIDYSVNPANKINVAKIATGLKRAIALALTDENGDKLLLVGTDIYPIDADYIIWKDLLTALNSNKRIDINGPLNGLKKFAKTNYKSNTDSRKINRQNTAAYALTYDANKDGYGTVIEGIDFYGMAKNFWADDCFDGIHSNYWWMKVGSSNRAFVSTVLPVLCVVEGASISKPSDIVSDYSDGDHDPVRFEVFYFKTNYEANVGGRNRIIFEEVDPTNGLISRLSSLPTPPTTVPLVVAGQPVSAYIDYLNHKFYIRDGFHCLFNKKYLYCETVEFTEISAGVIGRRSPMATGFISIRGHHSSSSAQKTSNLYSDTDAIYADDYLDGLYYATFEEGILRSTTRVLLYNSTDVIRIGSLSDTDTVSIYNASATGYNDLYTDQTITSGGSNDNKEYVCVFDDKGRITSMTLVGADPSF